jgi:transposase
MNTIPSATPVVHIGIDVAKASLQVDLQGSTARFANTPQGHRELARHLPPHASIVMEATGSYHLALLAFLHAKGIPAAVVNPARAKAFAKASGTLAKTDPLDAAMLSAFGRALNPPLSCPREPDRIKLKELLALRDQLLVQATMFENRLEHGQCAAVGKMVASLLKHNAATLAKLDKQIAALLAESATLAPAAQVMLGCKGVGPVTTAVLLSDMPELGRANRHQVAALAGLAPFANDSGNSSGRRSICAGRSRLKRALYLASLSAVRHHPKLKAAYKELRAKGKPAKVALIAIARRLLVILNAMLKEHFQQRPGSTPGHPA